MTKRGQLRKEETDLTVTNERRKKQKLRNVEYYTMQNVFDELHRQACDNAIFKNLMQYISCKENILLAYRNIKNNKGSITPGTDKLAIEHYKEWPEKQFVSYFQDKLANYLPKS